MSFTEAGGGTITNSGTYTKIGRLVFWTCKLVCAGGATIASVANTSNITGLPFVAIEPCPFGACNNDTLASYGVGEVTSNIIYPPTWSATAANQTVALSGVFHV